MTGPLGSVHQALTADPYRPELHYTPERDWTNDPNGLVYHDGVWHMYYQYNPSGGIWGNISWGHATSTDLMDWTEQPVAIPQTFNELGVPVEDIFSGSIVVDHDNTSGFGGQDADTNPPLVAVYTNNNTVLNPQAPMIQAQSLAYSTDGGYTWEKYEGNPVLDRGSQNFRDPKVFWHEGDDGEGYRVMAVVEATDHEVLLYRSDDLKDWDYLSTFGPANAVGGGSGGQYFVGDFDGTTFTADGEGERWLDWGRGQGRHHRAAVRRRFTGHQDRL